MQHRLTLFVIRALFFLLACGLGLYIAQDISQRAVMPSKGELQSLIERTPPERLGPALRSVVERSQPSEFEFRNLLLAIGLASLAVVAEIFFSRGNVKTLSAILFGIIVGTVLANLFVGLIALLGDYSDPGGRQALGYIRACLTLVLVYFAITTILRTKDDFKFIIPYVEFSKEMKGPRPYVVDTSAIIDGRIEELGRGKLFEAPLLVPSFVVEELHTLSDSKDKAKRARGRRGLDLLKALQETPEIDIQIEERDFPHLEGVDKKLLEMAEELEGKLVTTDYNLNKLADLRNVDVLNVNELARAVKVRHVPGDAFDLAIMKKGEGEGQGVGYLEDGTMVVVEDGAENVGDRVPVEVTNVYHSSGGRMIFARRRGTEDGDA